MSLIVVFTNDATGDAKMGNYNVGVFINKTQLWKGRVEGFKRDKGWRELVIKLAGNLLYRMGEHDESK